MGNEEKTIETNRSPIGPRDATDTEDLSWVRARKLPVVVRAALIDEPFTVTTAEGDVLRLDGGWLLEGDDGRRWPVDRAYFARHYEVLNDE